MGVRQQLSAATVAQVLDDGRVQQPAHARFAGHERVHERAVIVDGHPRLADAISAPVHRPPQLDRRGGGVPVIERGPVRHDGMRAAYALFLGPGHVRTDRLPASTAQICAMVARELQDSLCEPEPREPPAREVEMRADALAGRARAEAYPGPRDRTQQADQVWKQDECAGSVGERVRTCVAEGRRTGAGLREPRAAVAGRTRSRGHTACIGASGRRLKGQRRSVAARRRPTVSPSVRTQPDVRLRAGRRPRGCRGGSPAAMLGIGQRSGSCSGTSSAWPWWVIRRGGPCRSE